MAVIRVVWVHSFSTYARTCSYQGVRNVNFSENFAYVLNGCSLSKLKKKKQKTKMKKSTQVNNELPCVLSKKMFYRSKEMAKIVQNYKSTKSSMVSKKSTRASAQKVVPKFPLDATLEMQALEFI